MCVVVYPHGITQARETFAERKQATDELTRVHKKNRAELNALQETLR
jgi:hypothetical protein